MSQEETIAEIRRQAPILNAKLDETNVLIARREAELREANVQLTFWSEACFDQREYTDDNEEIVVEYWMVGLIEGPRFGAKLMHHHQCCDTIIEVGSPIPLSLAPVQVRVQAALVLGQLLKELELEMKHVVAQLDVTLMKPHSIGA